VSGALHPIGSPSGGVSTDTSRLASKENLEAAGQRFEAVFTGMMLKSMRQAKLGDGLFDSKGEEQFRDMQDQQLAQSMAAHAPIGIGKAMTDFLARNLKTETAAQPGTAPAAAQGGVVK
jgi:peptidoglycan hydrolase FlgJ